MNKQKIVIIGGIVTLILAIVILTILGHSGEDMFVALCGLIFLAPFGGLITIGTLSSISKSRGIRY